MFKDKYSRELSSKEAWTKIIIRVKNILLDFELMFLRWTGNIPSHSWRHLVYQLSGIKIGRGSTIHMWANFFQPKNIDVGNDTIIGDHCFLDGRARLKIGSHTDIASGVLIYNSKHDINDPEFKALELPVEIGDYVFIGPRALIMPGIKIGKGAIVAAGAIVTKNVADYQIVAGVPAKMIGERQLKDLHYRLGRARLFQ
jgi:maltose O-acetyltransferase